MTRILDADHRLRRLCLIKPSEAGYPRSVISRFIRRVGEGNLLKIIQEKVVKLLVENKARDVDAVFDASFIKAWSTRDPYNSQTGLSDREARVGRTGRTYGLGYKLHLSIDSETMLPLACTLASANENEKKHSLSILEKSKLVLKQSAAKLSSVIADSQYSSGKLRSAFGKAVTPYPSFQKPRAVDVLRVDRKFRTYGPDEDRKEYHKRPHIEAVYSFLKTQYSLAMNKVQGLGNVTCYALFSLLCLVLNREAAQNYGRLDKAVSPTFFNT
jgi:hypothetical protein